METKTKPLTKSVAQVKHTPGKWKIFDTTAIEKIFPDLQNSSNNGQLEIFAGDTPVAKIRNGFAREAKENARLIAAAPELLEALEGMLEWARRVKERNPGMEIANAMRAVLKAEGRDK